MPMPMLAGVGLLLLCSSSSAAYMMGGGDADKKKDDDSDDDSDAGDNDEVDDQTKETEFINKEAPEGIEVAAFDGLNCNEEMG